MSVEQTKVVDAIGIDNATGYLVLTITDHLEWVGRDGDHLLLLQEKLNTYLSFVESGELLAAYPNAAGRTVLINVVCKYPPSQQARDFYSNVQQVIESAGMKFNYRLFDEKNSS